jgi:hypothetical protein
MERSRGNRLLDGLLDMKLAKIWASAPATPNYPVKSGGYLWGIGGAEGDRTPDLVNAIHALSQLSYGPVPGMAGGRRLTMPPAAIAQEALASAARLVWGQTLRV